MLVVDDDGRPVPSRERHGSFELRLSCPRECPSDDGHDDDRTERDRPNDLHGMSGMETKRKTSPVYRVDQRFSTFLPPSTTWHFHRTANARISGTEGTRKKRIINLYFLLNLSHILRV